MKNILMKSRAILMMATAVFVLLFSSATFARTLKDPRDGKTYKTIVTGPLEWMAVNLNYKSPASMCYGDKPANCKKYGRLYKWDDAQNVCPEGWHLPSAAEYNALIAYVVQVIDDEYDVGFALKSRNGWKNDLDGSDTIGFNALPSGYFSSRDNKYTSMTNATMFWSSGAFDEARGLCLDLYDDQREATLHRSNKADAFSVRCVKN